MSEKEISIELVVSLLKRWAKRHRTDAIREEILLPYKCHIMSLFKRVNFSFFAMMLFLNICESAQAKAHGNIDVSPCLSMIRALKNEVNFRFGLLCKLQIQGIEITSNVSVGHHKRRSLLRSHLSDFVTMFPSNEYVIESTKSKGVYRLGMTSQVPGGPRFEYDMGGLFSSYAVLTEGNIYWIRCNNDSKKLCIFYADIYQSDVNNRLCEIYVSSQFVIPDDLSLFTSIVSALDEMERDISGDGKISSMLPVLCGSENKQ